MNVAAADLVGDTDKGDCELPKEQTGVCLYKSEGIKQGKIYVCNTSAHEKCRDGAKTCYYECKRVKRKAKE